LHRGRREFNRHVIVRGDNARELERALAAPKRVPLDDAPRGVRAAQFQPRGGERRNETNGGGDNQKFKQILSARGGDWAITISQVHRRQQRDG
jgi:hypothetical protein